MHINDLTEETFGVSYTGITGYERLGTVWFEWDNVNLGTINIDGFQTVFTIPQDYRPLNEFYLPIVIMGHDAQLYVSTNGTVQLKVKDTGIAYSSVSLMFSYHIH